MIFKGVSFISVLNSSHCYSSFTLKTKGGSDVIKFKGLRVTDALRWIARCDKEKFVGCIGVDQALLCFTSKACKMQSQLTLTQVKHTCVSF